MPLHVLARTNLSSSGKLIYAAIVDHMRLSETSWPSVRRLQAVVGISAGAIIRGICQLEKVGLLVVCRQANGKPTIYSLPNSEPPKRSQGGHGQRAESVPDMGTAKKGRPFPLWGSTVPRMDTEALPERERKTRESIEKREEPKKSLLQAPRKNEPKQTRAKHGRRNVACEASTSPDLTPQGLSSPQSRTGGAGQAGGCSGTSKPKESTGAPRKAPQGRPRNELWDAVVAEWFADGIPDSQRANVGKFVKEFRQLNATPAEIGIRRKRIRECWGAGKDTPASTLKHWSVFKDDQKPQNDRPSRIPVPKGKYDHLDRQAR